MAATEQVILVDENDNPMGTAEKLYAHQEGLCHRAFSVFVFCDDLLLLQQRAAGKYHSPGLWTNTCCSHPRPGEDIVSAGQRRLKEEMGLEIALSVVGRFHYIANFNNGLVENEVDYVLVGDVVEKMINPNSAEVAAYRWINVENLRQELIEKPEEFTPWLENALAVIDAAAN